jgi:hypothetical protein
MQSRIQEKKDELTIAKAVLDEMIKCINNHQYVSSDLLHKNENSLIVKGLNIFNL